MRTMILVNLNELSELSSPRRQSLAKTQHGKLTDRELTVHVPACFRGSTFGISFAQRILLCRLACDAGEPRIYSRSPPW